jgi:hypothetical protein
MVAMGCGASVETSLLTHLPPSALEAAFLAAFSSRAFLSLHTHTQRNSEVRKLGYPVLLEGLFSHDVL